MVRLFPFPTVIVLNSSGMGSKGPELYEQIRTNVRLEPHGKERPAAPRRGGWEAALLEL